MTTTHGSPGSGRPRLILVLGGHVLLDDPLDDPLDPPEDRVHQAEYELHESTTIGSGQQADLVFDGLEPIHAEIVHDPVDEYVVHDRSGGGGVAVDGARVREKVLRTGDLLQVGGVRLSFYREEFADHGRPYGGRQGGEFAHQRDQPPRRAG